VIATFDDSATGEFVVFGTTEVVKARLAVYAGKPPEEGVKLPSIPTAPVNDACCSVNVALLFTVAIPQTPTPVAFALTDRAVVWEARVKPAFCMGARASDPQFW
jgi:hypothetical protein